VLEVNEDALKALAILAGHLDHVDALDETEVGLLDVLPHLLPAHIVEDEGDADGRLHVRKLRKIEGLRHNFFSVIMAQGEIIIFIEKRFQFFLYL